MTRQIRTFSNDEILIAQRRKQIVKAATKLFLQKGYEHTNTRELTLAAGMSKGALYHYVGSKSDVLLLVLQFSLEDQEKLISRMEKRTRGLPSVEALQTCIQMYVENVDELQDMYNFDNHAIVDLSRDDRGILFDSESRMVDYFDKLLKKGIADKQFRVHDSQLVAHNIVVVANAWANRRWFLKRRYTLKDYIEKETENILNSVSV
jgi:AcrR family transcriptional regulator